jgi:hypothetical protein
MTAPASAPPPASTPPTGPALVDAARSYYDTLQQAAANPADGRRRLARLIHPSCSCREVLGLLDRLAREGHRLLFTVTTSNGRVSGFTDRTGTVFLHVQQSSGREVDAAGKTVTTTPASTGDYVLDFLRQDDRWVVGRITRTTR